MPLPDPTEVPATLTAWRRYEPPFTLPTATQGLDTGLIRGVWTPLEPFFESHGYILFDGSSPSTYPREAFHPSQLGRLHQQAGWPLAPVQRKADEHHYRHPDAQPPVSEFWTVVRCIEY